MKTVGKQEKWLQFTQNYPSKIRNDKLAMLNHNHQENSNLIMPFLVQNENKMKKRPNYTNKGFFNKNLSS